MCFLMGTSFAVKNRYLKIINQEFNSVLFLLKQTPKLFTDHHLNNFTKSFQEAA